MEGVLPDPVGNERTRKANVLKVKFQWKLTAFVFATLSLSLFFEGFRQVNKEPSYLHFALLLAGTVLTVLLLWLQAFWIYLEEKSKGSLTKKVVHFDRLESLFVKRAICLNNGDQAELSAGEISEVG